MSEAMVTRRGGKENPMEKVYPEYFSHNPNPQTYSIGSDWKPVGSYAVGNSNVNFGNAHIALLLIQGGSDGGASEIKNANIFMLEPEKEYDFILTKEFGTFPDYYYQDVTFSIKRSALTGTQDSTNLYVRCKTHTNQYISLYSVFVLGTSSAYKN